MAGKQVAKVEEAKAPSVFNYGDMSGAGFEGIKSSDLSIPFLNLLQSNSPQVEENVIPGVRSGLMLNSVTGELSEEIVLLPVHKQEAWVEWVPRNKGGGFVGIHETTSELVQSLIKANGGSRIPPKGDDGKRIAFKHNGNDVIETHYVYGLLMNNDGTETNSFAVIPFASTKIKPYRDWLTAMYLIKGKPPLFANRARIRTIKQKNDSGTYFNFSISPLRGTWVESLIDPNTEGSLIKEAVEFQKMIMSGAAKADFNQQNVATEEATDPEKAPF